MDIFCEYCIVAPYNSYCRCTKTNDICLYTYKCVKEKRNRPTPQMQNCKFRKDDSIPKDEYRVRFEDKGYLYVEVGNKIKKIKNTFDYTPDSVKLDENGELVVKKKSKRRNGK